MKILLLDYGVYFKRERVERMKTIKLTNEVTSQPLALKLKEALGSIGVEIETEKYWQWNCSVGKYFLVDKPVEIYPYEHHYSAPSSGELGQLLPIKKTDKSYEWIQYKINHFKGDSEKTSWTIERYPSHERNFHQDIKEQVYAVFFNEEKEADVRAAMLIHLIDSGHIKEGDL